MVGSQQRSEYSEEEDDMVHVNKDGRVPFILTTGVFWSLESGKWPYAASGLFAAMAVTMNGLWTKKHRRGSLLTRHEAGSTTAGKNSNLKHALSFQRSTVLNVRICDTRENEKLTGSFMFSLLFI